MKSLIILWYTVMIGMPDMNVPPDCGKSSDPTTEKHAEYFKYEEINEDGALIVRSKSSNSITDVYFKSKNQCEKYLSKYNQILRKEKYGE